MFGLFKKDKLTESCHFCTTIVVYGYVVQALIVYTEGCLGCIRRMHLQELYRKQIVNLRELYKKQINQERNKMQCTKQFDPLKRWTKRNKSKPLRLEINLEEEQPLQAITNYGASQHYICGHFNISHSLCDEDLINVEEESEEKKWEEINNELIRLKDFLNEMMRKIISFQERWIFK